MLFRSHPALRSGNFYPDPWDEHQGRFNEAGFGVDTAKQVVIYHRWAPLAGGAVERFIVVVNFSGFDQWVDIPFSVNGPWQDLLNGWTSTVSNFRLANERINSNWGRVYIRRD